MKTGGKRHYTREQEAADGERICHPENSDTSDTAAPQPAAPLSSFNPAFMAVGCPKSQTRFDAAADRGTIDRSPPIARREKTMIASLSLYRSTDLRRIEAAAADQPLMQRAGQAAANLAAELCHDTGAAILILAGPGNNGGDAFEAATRLRERFFAVDVVFPGSPERLPHDAAAACQRFIAGGGRFQGTIPEQRRWSLIIDGLFGIGLTRPIDAPYTSLVRQANTLAQRDRCPLLALDCPSGLNADTGHVIGDAITASHTITFIGHKPGLFTADGPDHCGEIRVAPLDLDAEAITPAPGHLLDLQTFSAHARPRRQNSHKGTYGNAGILGGAAGMTGAALLAARAALRLGSGRVYVGLLDECSLSLDPLQPELMLRAPECLFDCDLTALACGPGLGHSDVARKLLGKALHGDCPLVLDADALNLLAADADLQTVLSTRPGISLLTPHPAEAARLLDRAVAAVQADRVTCAQELAHRFNAHVALKGCGTVIVAPHARWAINTTGNPGLATAGSGDVLTGMIVALLAQGWPAEAALKGAVHLHGAAADCLVKEGIGPIGLTAGELIDAARHCLNHWSAV